MKKLLVILGLSVMLLLGCVTMNQVEYGKQYATHTPIDFANEDVSATLQFDNQEWVSLTINNSSDTVIQFITDLSSFTSISGDSSKLVPDGTKYIDAKNVQPSVAIPPNSKFAKTFFSANSIYYASGQYGGWETSAWIPNSLEGSSFVFTYKLNGIDKYIIFGGDKSVSSMPKSDKILGTITVKQTYWNFLFLNSVENRRNNLFENAEKEAKEKYGSNIQLKNLRYVGDWNPASLLFYFSMLGFVEDAALTVDIVEIEK